MHVQMAKAKKNTNHVVFSYRALNTKMSNWAGRKEALSLTSWDFTNLTQRLIFTQFGTSSCTSPQNTPFSFTPKASNSVNLPNRCCWQHEAQPPALWWAPSGGDWGSSRWWPRQAASRTPCPLSRQLCRVPPRCRRSAAQSAWAWLAPRLASTSLGQGLPRWNLDTKATQERWQSCGAPQVAHGDIFINFFNRDWKAHCALINSYMFDKYWSFSQFNPNDSTILVHCGSLKLCFKFSLILK